MRVRGGAVPITTTLACGMKPSRCGMTASSVAGESGPDDSVRVCGLRAVVSRSAGLSHMASVGCAGPAGAMRIFLPVDNPGVIHRLAVRLDNWGRGCGTDARG